MELRPQGPDGLFNLRTYWGPVLLELWGRGRLATLRPGVLLAGSITVVITHL